MMTPAYTLGLFFVCLVALIWAASSVLVQSIYQDADTEFDSPFLVTYIGVSLFSLWLVPDLLGCLLSMITSGRLVTQETGEQETLYENVSLQDDDEVEQQQHSPTRRTATLSWTVRDHIRAAAQIAPVWFLANWTYNASLDYTSITSSTVLASTGSLFTFLLALYTGDELSNKWKWRGVVCGVTGSMVTALQDGSETRRTLLMLSRMLLQDNHTAATAVWGDVLGLISAMGYGAYAVQTRVLCPSEEDSASSSFRMQRLLGYIGLWNMVILSPFAIYQLLRGGSGGSMTIPQSVWILLLIKGLLDNVLSDYLWLRAVMLTNATVATVGLGLTIPLAFLSDILLPHPNDTHVLSLPQLVGAIAVLSGFVMVNVGEQQTVQDNNNDTHDESGNADTAAEDDHARSTPMVRIMAESESVSDEHSSVHSGEGS